MTRCAALLILWCLSAAAHAHKPSDSYLTLDVRGAEIVGQWDIAVRDLDYAIGLDSNEDGLITWGELRARRDDIDAYALARLRLGSDRGVCAIERGRQWVDEHSDGAYHVLMFVARCAAAPRELTVSYRLFADVDAQHRGLLRLVSGAKTRSDVLGAEHDERPYALDGGGEGEQFSSYFRDGVRHIWTGYDHVLFLIALLLPSVLQRRDGRWQGTDDARAAVMDTVKIVTAFTLAHSITLSLAVLDIVRPPSRLVEAVIAASVVLAAVNNLFPIFHRRRWQIAFLFGLMHGFGFAAVLTDLGLAAGALAASLVAFNLGVEAGQLAIVSVFLPVALWLRHSSFYRRGVVVAGSWSVVAVAGLWFVQRAFDLGI